MGRELAVKGHKGTFQGDKNVLELDCGIGYTILLICQNSLKFTLKINIDYVSQLILRKEEDLMYSFVNFFHISVFLYS